MRVIFFALLFTIVDICTGDPAGRPYFSNPILSGFYPVPTICRVDSDYYLVTSSFSYFPGLPIFKSRDLVHWTLIGHVLNRPEQLNLDHQGVSRGLFAPSIRYHKGTFYITCTLVDIGGNFVVTATRPEGPWSNPVWLPQVNGIDPSLFFDEVGRASLPDALPKSYIIYNSIPPNNTPLYPGHRTIRMYQFDPVNLKVLGEEKLLVNGGTDISKKPVWIEAPHIFKRDGAYYLICAEGGTGDQHSEVVFRSAKPDGPYIAFEQNPILTQRNLDPSRPDPITSTGHADLVETQSGEWWAVFLGCRPYDNDFYNTGRETFLAPVRWVKGWPLINPDFKEVQYRYVLPDLPISNSDYPYSGNYKVRDQFDGPSLDLNWTFLRTPHERWYDLGRRKGYLSIKLRPESCSGDMNPSFLARRQSHLTGSTSAALDFTGAGENEKAGILVFQSETHYYFLCKSVSGGREVVQLFKGSSELLAETNIESSNAGRVELRIDFNRDNYSFRYAIEPGKWLLLKEGVDGRFLSTRVAGGFVGCMIGMYATSMGKPSERIADFDWFEYSGNDGVYGNVQERERD